MNNAYQRLTHDETPEAVAAAHFADLGISPEFVSELDIADARVVIGGLGQVLNRSFHPDRYTGSFDKLPEQNLAIDNLLRLTDTQLETAIKLAAGNHAATQARRELLGAIQARDQLAAEKGVLVDQVCEVVTGFESLALASMTGLLVFNAGVNFDEKLDLSAHAAKSIVKLRSGVIADFAVVAPAAQLYKKTSPDRAAQLLKIREPGTQVQQIVITDDGRVFDLETGTYRNLTVNTKLLAEGMYTLKDAVSSKDPSHIEPGYVSYADDESTVIGASTQLIGSRMVATLLQPLEAESATLKSLGLGETATFDTLVPLKPEELQHFVGTGLVRFDRPSIVASRAVNHHMISYRRNAKTKQPSIFLHSDLTQIVDYDTLK